MVAGKMRAAMGLNKTPSPASSATTKPSPQPPPPPPQPPSSSGKSAHLSKSQVFSRSFGVYFPRSSAQVQPKPPDVAELLRLVEELRDRESILKTEILSCKLLKESAAIVPAMEKELFEKEAEIARAYVRVESLEKENAELRREREEREGQVEAMEKRMREIEEEIAEMKKTEKRFQGLMEVSVRSNLIKNLKKNLKSNESSSTSTNQQKLERSDSKREEEVETHAPPLSNITEEFSLSTSLRSRIPRVPKPPPRPSSSSASSNGDNKALLASIPPPPPPPPPMSKVKVAPPPPPPPMPKGRKAATEKVKRVPEVVEFYHSLMRRDSRRDSGGGGPDAPATANARDMIGEIENRSAYLLAIKTDVETQGEFIRFLIKEVENAAFTDINDVVPFVKWLDDELSYLVDERAVLKHFDWPEQKADALREAAFGYCDLKKLQTEASSFPDHSRQPIGSTLKKMQALLEKLEHGVYNLSRMRESATKRYKVFQIPTNWMLDTEFVSQIKLASIKLATKYMKRVSAELELVGGGGPEEEELIVQGVRFAFRVHQFAGGFDAETMRAFQVLRDKVRSCHVQCQNQQQQQKIICKSTPC